MIKLIDILLERDTKVGTGKKPKGSGRRLYTDENPKDTVRIKFKTVQDIKDTLSKTSFKSKPHAYFNFFKNIFCTECSFF